MTKAALKRASQAAAALLTACVLGVAWAAIREANPPVLRNIKEAPVDELAAGGVLLGNRAMLEIGLSAGLLHSSPFEVRPIAVMLGFAYGAPIGVPLRTSTRHGEVVPRDAELARIAYAVEGAESSHGTDLRMWRPDPNAPQGPMQVSEAAALDVGGGDRFDLHENRLIGQAYLARMYRRYGNWQDTVVAYLWGPRNLDAWIEAGRPAEGLPLEVERYCARVLGTSSAPLHRWLTTAASPGVHLPGAVYDPGSLAGRLMAFRAAMSGKRPIAYRMAVSSPIAFE